MSTTNGSISDSLLPFELPYDEQAADPALLGYAEILEFLSFEGLPDEVQSSTDWSTPAELFFATSQEPSPSENSTTLGPLHDEREADRVALMSLPYFSWDEGEDYHSEISSQVIGGAPSAVSESTGPIFEEASDGEDVYDYVPPSIAPSLLSLPAVAFNKSGSEDDDADKEGGPSDEVDNEVEDEQDDIALAIGKRSRSEIRIQANASCGTCKSALIDADSSWILEPLAALPICPEEDNEASTSLIAQYDVLPDISAEPNDTHEPTSGSCSGGDNDDSDYDDKAEKRSIRSNMKRKARTAREKPLDNSQTNSIQLVDERMVWNQGEAIETLPPNRSAVFRHLSDPHNLVGLFPHSTSTRKFPVRNRADHGEAVTDKKFRCETRTSLDIDDDGWVEIPYCGAVLTGKENYRRHLKSVHLRMPRIAKASLSLSEWAEKNTGGPSTRRQKRKVESLEEEECAEEDETNDDRSRPEERPCKKRR